MNWNLEYTIITGIAVTILAIGWFSNSLLNVVMIIPGHFIIALFKRYPLVERLERTYDATGNLSLAVGIAFWVLFLGGGYVAYHLAV